MPTDDLKNKVQKAVLKIEERVTDMVNILHDINMKLCHLIKNKRSYQDMLEGREFPS